MHGDVVLSEIIVGGTNKGRLSEFFKKELRDAGIPHGGMYFLGCTSLKQGTIIRLFFVL